MVFVVFSSSFSLAGFWLRDQYLIPVRFPLSLGKGMLAVTDCISPFLNQKACHHAITCWLSTRPTWNLSSGIQMVQVPESWFMISDCLLQQCYFKRNVFVPINHLCWCKQWYTLGLWWYESYGSCNTSKKKWCRRRRRRPLGFGTQNPSANWTFSNCFLSAKLHESLGPIWSYTFWRWSGASSGEQCPAHWLIIRCLLMASS